MLLVLGNEVRYTESRVMGIDSLKQGDGENHPGALWRMRSDGWNQSTEQHCRLIKWGRQRGPDGEQPEWRREENQKGVLSKAKGEGFQEVR